MIEEVLRYLLREHAEQEVEWFLRNIWGLMDTDDYPNPRKIMVGEVNEEIRSMVEKIPFLKLNEARREISIVEFTTGEMPEQTINVGLRGLRFIVNEGMDKTKLGYQLSGSSREETRKKRVASVLHDLKLFSLINSQNQVEYNGNLVLINDLEPVRRSILQKPCMEMYYKILKSLQRLESRKKFRDAFLAIIYVIIRNPRENNLILPSVAMTRVQTLFSWFHGLGFIDQDLRIIHHEKLLFKKKVDWSLFEDGLAIPRENLDIFFAANQERLEIGESREGKFLFGNREFKIAFRNSRRGVQGDTVHIRYDSNRELKEEVQKQFQLTYSYIQEHKEGKRKQVKIPEELAEYLLIYSTEQPYHYKIEFLTSLALDVLEAIYELSPEEYQQYLEEKYGKTQASVAVKEGLIKYRQACNALVDELKAKYKNRCQICQNSFHEKYGVEYSEAHHIKLFAKHQNHRPDNIVILCPDHHRVIHKAKPKYDSEKKAFEYENGLVEYLELNEHL